MTRIGEKKHAYRVRVLGEGGVGARGKDDIELGLKGMRVTRKDVDWFALAPNSGKWWAVMNKVMNLQLP
jgi:hypothetical protein